MFEILPALRRSRSLLALHAGSNPGINERIQEFYFKKLRCAEADDNFTIQIKKEKNGFKELLSDPVAMKKLSEVEPAGIKALEYKSKMVESLRMRETMFQNEVN